MSSRSSIGFARWDRPMMANQPLPDPAAGLPPRRDDGGDFCPECGRPWGAMPTLASGEAGPARPRVWPWVLVALGLYVVVAHAAIAWADYRLLLYAERDRAGALTAEEQFKATEDAGVARVYLASDEDELALGAFAVALGLAAVARRRLRPSARPPSPIATPWRWSGGLENAVYAAWALGETIGMSFYRLLLVAYVVILAELLIHGASPSPVLADRAWRDTVALVGSALRAVRTG